MEQLKLSETLTPEEYNQLRASVGWETLTPRQARDGLAGSAFYVAFRDGEKPVAMGRVLFDHGYTAYLADIIVTPGYQRHGLGSKVVKALIHRVLATCAPGEKILFALGAAYGKEPFYETMGFYRRPNDQEGHGMNQWITVGQAAPQIEL